MISVREAFAIASHRPRPSRPVPVALETRDQERQLAKLEAAVDGVIHDKFNGMPVQLQFAEVVPQKITQALKDKYESTDGGWNVIVKYLNLGTQLSFIPDFLPSASKIVEKLGLPAVMSTVVALPASRRLLVRMPTRGRPVQALSVLQKYREMAGCEIKIEVVLDEDDETMLAAEVLQRLCALGCTITVGCHKSKVEACNGGRVMEWDVLLLASDDMCPIVDGYAVRVLEEMKRAWPHLDGAIYFDDGMQGPNLCTMPIMGKRWYDRWGVVYAPQYTSLFCDTEQTELWKEMARLVYVDELLIEHRHHAWRKAENDALYQKNDAFWDADRTVYEQRKVTRREYAQCAFDSSPLWLSICVCTLPARRAQLERLLDELYYQTTRKVEVLVDSREDITIGEKRQALLERAKGHFVAFIDDDDWIDRRYVERILAAFRENPDVDCVTISGVMTTAGAVPEKFEHSIKHAEWRTEGGRYLRSPNHLNPVRRELALQAGFPSLSHAEDVDYSKRLQPLLKTEVSIPGGPLYFYFYQPRKS